MPGMPPKVTWHVTAQTQDTEFDQNNNQIPGKRVQFETSTGYAGSVFIPDNVYGDPATVKQVIQAEVDAVAAVHGLSG